MLFCIGKICSEYVKKHIDIIATVSLSTVIFILAKNTFYNTGVGYIWLVLFMLLVCLTNSIMMIKKIEEIPIEKLFFLVTVLSGVLLALINPFGQEPDGWIHFIRSLDVSYGNLLAPFWDNNGNTNLMTVPLNISEIGFKKIEINASEAISYMENIKKLYFSSDLTKVNSIGGFSSFFYLPQALGLFIARAFKLSVYGHMVLGRVFNLLIYVFLSYVGLKKIPVFKNIYMMIAFLPITVYQAASFSYDAMLMGLCFLFIALCMNYAYREEEVKWHEVFILGIILAALILCKYVYVCIGALVFIIPMRKMGDTKSYWKSFFIALIPMATIFLLMFLSSAMVISTNPAAPEIESGQITQLEYVIRNPVHLIKVFLRTFESYFAYHTEQISTLGWLNFKLGPLIVLIPVFMGIVSVLDTNHISGKVSIKDKIIYLATFGVTVCAAMLGLYLMDSFANPVGATVILGYQGRYTIPVLMLLLISLSSKNIKNQINNFSYKVLSVMSFFMCITVMMLIRYCY